MSTDLSTDAATIFASRPAPRVSPRDVPFWEGTARGELHVQHCTSCDEHYFPSQERCPNCHSTDVEWAPVETTGTLYTFTVIHGPGTEGRPRGFEDAYPYAVGVVEIDRGRGARIPGNIIVDRPVIGMRLRAEFQPGEQGLPVFVPSEA